MAGAGERCEPGHVGSSRTAAPWYARLASRVGLTRAIGAPSRPIARHLWTAAVSPTILRPPGTPKDAPIQLTVRKTAELLRVSEKTVYRWVADRGLPAHRVGDQYRFNRAELLEWVIANRINAAPNLFEEPETSGAPLPRLADALEAGGIHYRVEGDDRDSVLRSVARNVRLPEGTDPDFVFELLRSRELLGSTAVGDGIAIPHPRHPLVLHVTQPSISLCFLEQPIEYGALDGKPVAALFLILSPTVRAHLHLLSRLAFALQQPGFRAAVMEQATRQRIQDEARHCDELASRARATPGPPT